MIVDIERLTVVFRQRLLRKRRVALNDVSLQIEEGEALALIGPDGAGKSTTVLCMLGLLRPTSGGVRVFGQALEPGCAAFRDIAFLPEVPHYHDYLTVEEAVRYYAKLWGEEPSNARLTRALEQLRLDHLRTTRLSMCSKSIKHKIGIVPCLLHQPRLLIVDDPWRDLDSVTVSDLRSMLIDLHRNGVTIVMSSGVVSDVQQIANRAAILSNGKLIASKRLDQLTRDDSPDPQAPEPWPAAAVTRHA